MISDQAWAELLETRAVDPARSGEVARYRVRRPRLRGDGKLFLLAADHAARRTVQVGDRPLAMADRRDLLDRLLIGLADHAVDGLLASPDIVEELLLLHGLDDRIVVGTMNRGGLAGSVWELDDPFTAYDADTVDRLGLDGGKMLVRIDPDDRDTRPTLSAAADAVTDLSSRGLMAMIEPLSYTRGSGGTTQLDPSVESLVRVVGVAASLGTSSAHTWLKLPASDGVEQVMAATTLPALILGGAPAGDPDAAFARWEKALAVPNVRGLVVGRTLLYPPDGDVAAAVRTAGQFVHPDTTAP